MEKFIKEEWIKKDLVSDVQVKKYDFSKSNISKESRIDTVTTIASICYNSKFPDSYAPKLYNKLAMESIGLPSSSFEFVPIVFDFDNNYHLDIYESIKNKLGCDAHIFKFGYKYNINNKEYRCTNLRALMMDIEDLNVTYKEDLYEKMYNTTDKTIQIIKDKFKVFHIEMSIVAARQFVRHRTLSYQELSRRYTTDKKSPIEFSMNLGEVVGIGKYYENVLDLYHELLDKGYKAEDARRILPLNIKTKMWVAAWDHKLTWENFKKLRLKTSAQKEIRTIAKLIFEDEPQRIKND